jgi:hypothetical protein
VGDAAKALWLVSSNISSEPRLHVKTIPTLLLQFFTSWTRLADTGTSSNASLRGMSRKTHKNTVSALCLPSIPHLFAISPSYAGFINPCTIQGRFRDCESANDAQICSVVGMIVSPSRSLDADLHAKRSNNTRGSMEGSTTQSNGVFLYGEIGQQ